MRTLLILLGVAAHLAAAERSGPGTAIVVTPGDSVVRVAATGEDGRGAPITADTPMRVASLSKTFTAAAVLALVDAGTVDLDRPIARYLPEFRMADPRASAIAVRQLLNQTSGLSDRTIDIDAAQRAADLTAYVAALASSRLAAAPGTHWE
jgi:CubicO group peptidase (beta-lactamase class C family)